MISLGNVVYKSRAFGAGGPGVQNRGGPATRLHKTIINLGWNISEAETAEQGQSLSQN